MCNIWYTWLYCNCQKNEEKLCNYFSFVLVYHGVARDLPLQKTLDSKFGAFICTMTIEQSVNPEKANCGHAVQLGTCRFVVVMPSPCTHYRVSRRIVYGHTVSFWANIVDFENNCDCCLATRFDDDVSLFDWSTAEWWVCVWDAALGERSASQPAWNQNLML